MDKLKLPDDDELKRRVQAFKKRCLPRSMRPKTWDRSVEFAMKDLALLSRIDRSNLRQFLRGKRRFREPRKLRLYRALLEVEGGYVTKTQYGVYHFFDTPQRPPVKVMQINLGTGQITQDAKQGGILKMPGFFDVLGG